MRALLIDCDTGWQIRTGDWILQHGQVPSHDLFSFTMPDQKWFAWEWGWDVLFSLVHSRWALSGVVLANLAILGLVAVLLYRLVRRKTANDVLAFAVTSVALFGSSVHWLARPHLLSWVFILCFLHLIDRAENNQMAVLWWCPVLTVFWVNIHGSFFLGAAFLLIYGAVNTFQELVLRPCPLSGFQALLAYRTYFLCAFACLLASLANPYGWHLHEHVIRYLLDAKQLSQISEYASIDFHLPVALRFELFLLLGACAAYRALTQKEWAPALMALIWAHFALKSARNVPIFLFVSAPPIGAFLSASLQSISESSGARALQNVAREVLSFGQDFRMLERVERIPVLPLVSLALLGIGLGLWPGERRIVDFDARDFPVAAASAITRLNRPRIFTFDQWGDYLAYRFFPQRIAFVDDRSDFYGAAFTETWANALRARYDWPAELSRFAIDTVLLKPNDPLASVLKESREWNPIFDDGRAVVFHKRASNSPDLQAVLKPLQASFPVETTH